MKMNRGFAPVMWLLVALLLVSAAFAQETTAGIQGTVKDPQGLVVSKATVEVTGTKLIGAKKVETDASGYYRFANLPIGEYTLTVTAQGFRTLKQTGLKLEVGTLPTVDLKLEVGGVEQTVEVSSAAPLVDVTQSKVQTNVTSDVLAGIPKGRSFQSVIAFAPGARQEPLMGNGYQIDGASNAENSYLVEGQDTGNVQTGVSQVNVPMEFTQEVQIKSGGFEAEYGGALGGVVNVIQKRGGNAWHGSVMTYYEGDMFNAAPNRFIRAVPGATTNFGTRFDVPREYYQPKKDSYRIVEPGFEVGGYLKKDRLWLFSSLIPRINHTSRTVNWDYNDPAQVSGYIPTVPTIQGPRRFTQDVNTYYSLVRADALVTNKIRVFGTWQNSYQTGYGYTTQTNNTFATGLPTADDVFGKVNTTAGGMFPNGTIRGGQNPDNFVATRGYKSPNVVYNTGADITLTPNLIATTRYGYFFNDEQTRGNSVGDLYQWSATATSAMRSLATGDTGYTYANAAGTQLQAVNPAAIQNSGFQSIAPPFVVHYDKYWRKSFSQDVAFFKKGFLGTHNFKGGYALNKLSNDVNSEYLNSRIQLRYGGGLAFSGTDQQAACDAINTYNNTTYGTTLPVPAVTRCGGLYGYFFTRDITTKGKVASNNQALYVQDAWTPGGGLTLNLGIRFDKEELPNFATALSNFKGISWGFGDKIAPRLGASWDVLRNGKLKVYGSFGYFFDIMKYELPRGSFGGDYWHDCYYALDDPNFRNIRPVKAAEPLGHDVYCNPTGGGNFAAPINAGRTGIAGAGVNGLIANLDFRKPSNDANDYKIEPNLKPMKQHEMTLGGDWAINNTLGLETRYTRKRLDRTIEDAGYLDNTGSEPFFIVNPGEGIHKFGLVPATDCPTGECNAQPKAVRNYDSLELRLVKKASDKWFGVLSYTYSKLYGNYGGLTSAEVSDGGSNSVTGGGRLSPNVSRSFDEPMMQFDGYGRPAMGVLPTDRPNTFKAFGYYRIKWLNMETLIGGTQFAFSGTPLSTYMTVSNNAGVPVFVEGRGKWVTMHRDATTGDMVFDGVSTRRTPSYTQTDLNLVQEMKLSKTNENLRLSFEANISNLFNQHAPTAYFSQLVDDTGYLDPALHLAPTSCTVGACFDYPTFLKYGFGANHGWVDEFNNEGLIVSNTYNQISTWQTGRSMRFKLAFKF